MIREVFGEKCVEDFFLLRKIQFVRQCEDDFFVTLAVRTFITVCRMEKFQRGILCPTRHRVSRGDAAAAHFMSGFAVDVLEMGGGECAVRPLLENVQDGIRCAFYIAPSCASVRPSHSQTGLSSPSSEV